MANEVGAPSLGMLQSTRDSSAGASRKSEDPPSEKPVSASGVSAQQFAADATKEASEVEQLPGKDLNDVVSELNGLAQGLRRGLQFAVDEDSGDVVVKVIDKETNEVVRQIPAEETLELRKRLSETAGIIFRDQV